MVSLEASGKKGTHKKGGKGGKQNGGKRGAAPRDGEDRSTTPPPAGKKGGGKAGGKGSKKGGKKGDAYSRVPVPPEYARRAEEPADGVPRCYATGDTLDTPGCILGVGVGVFKGEITTPAELLSLKAFQSGVTRSSDGRRYFQYFLPLSISAAHHKRVTSQEQALGDAVEAILDDIGRRDMLTSEGWDICILHVCAHLMSYLIAEATKVNAKHVLRKLVDCYCALLYTTELTDRDYNGSLSKYARDRVVGPFVDNVRTRRSKRMMPDTNFFVALLPLAGETWGTRNISGCLSDEVLARTVFDIVEGTPEAPGPYPELVCEGRSAEEVCAKTWVAMHDARMVLAFQKAFCDLAESLSADALEEARYYVPNEAKIALRRTKEAVAVMKTWKDFFLHIKRLIIKPTDKNKKDPNYVHWSATILRSVISLSDQQRHHGSYRHEAYGVFLKDAAKRARPLSHATIGEEDSGTGRMKAENDMRDYIPSQI
eukprot:Rhum_TRINITY_DN14870_c13_g1::Rhum_TRINITY_DN14870_c13_g1_i2::g.126271::m.126271